MAKDKTAYVCSECGQESSKWMGKCPNCGRWNTFKEIRIAADSGTMAAKAAAQTLNAHRSLHQGAARPIPLREISAREDPRIDTRDAELNRVLGGGLVPGSLVLIGGEPGIGKSTLTLQTILRMQGVEVMYVSGEESPHQIKMRAERIDKGGNDIGHVTILCETSLESIFACIREAHPQLVVIDSIQTISTEDVDSSPGSVSQIRECASA